MLRREVQVRRTPPQDLVLRPEFELDIGGKLKAGRGLGIEGVDEDMILQFWAINPDI